jgi:hypothetical protein
MLVVPTARNCTGQTSFRQHCTLLPVNLKDFDELCALLAYATVAEVGAASKTVGIMTTGSSNTVHLLLTAYDAQAGCLILFSILHQHTVLLRDKAISFDEQIVLGFESTVLLHNQTGFLRY